MGCSGVTAAPSPWAAMPAPQLSQRLALSTATTLPRPTPRADIAACIRPMVSSAAA